MIEEGKEVFILPHGSLTSSERFVVWEVRDDVVVLERSSDASLHEVPVVKVLH